MVFHYDPVCGKKLNRNKAHIELEHGGDIYLLCCPRCQSEFERDPEEYARHGRGRRPARSHRK